MLNSTFHPLKNFLTNIMSDHLHHHEAVALPTGTGNAAAVEHAAAISATANGAGNGGLQLVLFSAFMFVGSYVAGSVPMYMGLSEEWLHLTSVMGAGLLLGEKVEKLENVPLQIIV